MASVLETFLILFESNADDVDKAAKNAKQSTDKLENSIDKVGGSFVNMAKQAAAAMAAVFSFGAVMGAVMDSARLADKLDEDSEALGIQIEELSAWGDAAKMAGGSSEAFRGSLKTLAGNMAQMDTLGKSRVAPFFKELGINMQDSAGKSRPMLELLQEMAAAFEGMSEAESLGFGRKMGLDEGTIMLLQRGRRGLDELIQRQKELGVITKRDGEIAAKFFDQWDDAAHAFRSVAMIIGSAVLPVLTKMLSGMEAIAIWVRENKNFVIGFFGFLGLVVASILIPAIAAAVAASAVILKVIAAVVALGVAMALVFDDIMAYLQGIPSVTGMIVDKVVGAFKIMGEEIKGVFQDVKDFFTGWYDGIISDLGKIKDFFNFGGDNELKMSMAGGQSTIAGASASNLNPLTTNSIMNNRQSRSTSVNIGEVNVQTQATDSDAIAKTIGDGLQSQMRQTVNGVDDGIAG